MELGIPLSGSSYNITGSMGDASSCAIAESPGVGLGSPRLVRTSVLWAISLPKKAPDILIEAIGSPPLAAVSDAHVTFIGDGGLKESLLARATALGIRDRVSFLGRVPPDEVALRFSASDVLCLPSRREGCPNVVLESLASGRPVVAAAVGGVPELLHDGNGIMAPSDDPSALARAIVSALRREWDPAALRATVPSLSWDDMGQKLHTVISRAIGERTK